MCCVQKNPPPGPGFRPQSQSERSSSPINGDSSPSPEGSQINLAASGSSGANGSSGQSDIPGKHDSNATLTAATPQRYEKVHDFKILFVKLFQVDSIGIANIHVNR